MHGPTFAPTLPEARLAPRPEARPDARPAPRRPAAAPPPAAGGGPMVFTYLRLHALLIGFVGTLLAGPLAYAAWTLMPSKFESSALLQVASSPLAIGSGNDPRSGRTDFATFVKTMTQQIRSPLVLNSALSDPAAKISELPTLKEQKEPIRYLEQKFVVSSSEGSELIRLSLEGDRPDDLRKIVDAVKDAYHREIIQRDLAVKVTQRDQLIKAQSELKDDLVRQSKLPVLGAAFAARPGRQAEVVAAGGALPEAEGPPLVQVGGPSPAGAAGAAASDAVRRMRGPIVNGRVAALEIKLAELPTQIGEKEADLKGVEAKLAEAPPAPPPEALAAAERDEEVRHKALDAGQKLGAYRATKSVARVSGSAREREQLDAANKAKAEYERARDAKAAALVAEANKGNVERLTAHANAVRRDLERLRASERTAKAQLILDRKELSELPPDAHKADQALPAVDADNVVALTYGETFHNVTRQLILLKYEIESPPRVRIIQPASVPSQGDPKKQVIATAVAALMGFVLVGFGAVAFEMSARRVSSLGELTAMGPAAVVVGVVPWVPSAATVGDPMKRADLFMAVDRLRAHVAQAWLARGVRTIAVTSPLGDEGRAFTAFRLASSLAETGTRTLIIDLDLRNPTLDSVAGVPNTPGLCEILRGESDAHAAQIVLASGLVLLPAGRWSDDPVAARGMPLGHALEMLLAKVRPEFDCVVLHSHSLLTAADSIEAVRRADAVLVCTLYRETRLPLLKRSLERLATMEVAHSGVVYLGASTQEALC